MYDLKNFMCDMWKTLGIIITSLKSNGIYVVFEYFTWNILTSEKYTWCHQTGYKSWCGSCSMRNSKRVFSILSSLPIKSITNNSHFTLIGCNNPQMKGNLLSVLCDLLNIILIDFFLFLSFFCFYFWVRVKIFSQYGISCVCILNGKFINVHICYVIVSVIFILWYWSKNARALNQHLCTCAHRLSKNYSTPFSQHLKRFERREKKKF